MTNYSIKREALQECIEGLVKLIPSHNDEVTEHAKRGIGPNPLFDAYICAESEGRLLLVIVRKNLSIVGYFSGFMDNALHYGNVKTLTTDAFYVSPDERGASLGVKLFNEVSSIAKELGVQHWRSSAMLKTSNHAHDLHKQAGFEPEETVYGMWLEG